MHLLFLVSRKDNDWSSDLFHFQVRNKNWNSLSPCPRPCSRYNCPRVSIQSVANSSLNPTAMSNIWPYHSNKFHSVQTTKQNSSYKHQHSTVQQNDYHEFTLNWRNHSHTQNNIYCMQWEEPCYWTSKA